MHYNVNGCLLENESRNIFKNFLSNIRADFFQFHGVLRLILAHSCQYPIYNSNSNRYTAFVMGNQIVDKYTPLRRKFSRQYLWQLRRKAQGKCIICGQPAVTKLYCLSHQLIKYQYRHKYSKSKKQYNCLSKRLLQMSEAGVKIPGQPPRKSPAVKRAKPTRSPVQKKKAASTRKK